MYIYIYIYINIYVIYIYIHYIIINRCDALYYTSLGGYSTLKGKYSLYS